ncbi:MAG: hypothetical protein ACRD3C_08390 [Vicinamibacterales bacterium]
MNRARVGLLCLLVAFVFAPLPAGAQNGVSARLDALEARVRKLESGQVQENDLVGSYAGVAFALDLTGTPKVQTETGVGTFTLNADHTASFTGRGAHCLLEQVATWSVACDPSHTGSFSGTGTWSIDANGSLVIQDSNGDDLIHHPNLIGAGGRVIISGGTADLTGQPTPEIYSIIQILIRLPNPPTP